MLMNVIDICKKTTTTTTTTGCEPARMTKCVVPMESVLKPQIGIGNNIMGHPVRFLDHQTTI